MSATINIKHASRSFNPILNFASSENNLSWSFTEEGDGEIYEITTNNVATLTIGGNAVTLPFTGVISVTNANNYTVAITKTTNGQTASVSIKSRRAVDKVENISVIDLGDLAITSNYILLTNVGNNGQVVVTQNSNIDPSNYVGAGVWTNSIIRGIVNLPDIATPYGGTGNAIFSWTFCIHVKFNGADYVAVVGHATASNTNRGRAVCLINPTTLAVTNLDFVANSHTYINTFVGGSANSNSQSQPFSYAENFISNKIFAAYTNLNEIDLNTRTWIGGFPLDVTDIGTQTKRESYFNPISQAYIGLYGQFTKTRASTYAGRTNLGAYDYLRNSKLGTLTYWGRIIGYDFNGLNNFTLENSTSAQVSTIIKPKKDLLFLANNSYGGFMLQNSPYTMNVTLLTDKTWTTVIDASYANADGNKWLITTNNSRLIVIWCNRAGGTIQQAYYDLTATPIAICNDKLLISA